jgi:hypothetical protein
MLPYSCKIVWVYGRVAQWIEHSPSKRTVTGSNPVTITILNLMMQPRSVVIIGRGILGPLTQRLE